MSSYEVRNPATGQIVHTWPAASDADVEAMLEDASAAFEQWRSKPVSDRAQMLSEIANLMHERGEALAQLLTTEIGKPVREAHDEVKLAASIFQYYSDHGPSMLSDLPVESPFQGEAVLRKDALGPLLGVMPWNFPYYQTARFAAPNLVAGNVVVVKPSSHCPSSADAMTTVTLDAGLPQGVFRDARVSTAQVNRIIFDNRIVGVSVTGSEQTGAAVAEAAGRALKKCVLELGGSDPFIVLSTNDLDHTVRQAVAARMTNAGQSCISPKRFIVADELYDAFVDQFTERMARISPGDPSDPRTRFGPLATPEAVGEMLAVVEDARQKGATVQTGGRAMSGPGYYFEATVLTDVAPGMRAFEEELFGPIGVIYRVDGRDEAVRLANRSRFGLGAAVFSTDEEEGLAVAARLDSGMVWINSPEYSAPGLPFGGIKRSGFGRELGTHGIDEFVNVKLVHRPTSWRTALADQADAEVRESSHA
jgi:succinate-semialdehyde dehydrogenase/glutarate-semialdehyde dehydrogenase